VLKLDPSHFNLQTRSVQAQAALQAPVSLNFTQPTRLTTILARMGEAAGLRILVDWHDVSGAGWNPAAETKLLVDNQPLSAALGALLEPLDLTWRVVDPRTIQVVTPARLASQGELEVYKVGWIADESAAENVLAQLRAALGEGALRDDGGVGELRYEPGSKCLLAWLPQPKQRELEALLARLRPANADRKS
jgi:hypothetical protein